MKKLNLSMFNQITLSEVGGLMAWLQYPTSKLIPLRKLKDGLSVRPLKLDYMIQLCEDFQFIKIEQESVSLTEHGGRFANADLRKQKTILRAHLLSYGQVRALMDLLRQSETRRLQQRQIEGLLGCGSGNKRDRVEVGGFMEWAHACELIYYDKRNEEIYPWESDFPTNPPSTATAS